MLLYLILVIPFIILGFVAQRHVAGTFEKWSSVPSSTGRTGAETARAILDRNGLTDVEVRPVSGALTDHYDPRNRTVNLSEPVFGGTSVSAVSVAAHEVGHAIQHQKAYAPFQARATLAPVAQFGSASFMPLFYGGLVLMMLQQLKAGYWVMLVAVALFALGVLFQLVTLPVEFDASRRAKAQLGDMLLQPAGSQEAVGTNKVLGAAALTYVAAALAAVAQLVYFALQFLGNRN